MINYFETQQRSDVEELCGESWQVTKTNSVSSNELYAMQSAVLHTKHKCTKCASAMLGPLTYSVLWSTLLLNTVSEHIHITALYIEAIMKSWVSQLAETHGEMWRAAALLLIGFYSSCQCRCLNRARISFREGERRTNTSQSSLLCTNLE